MAFRLEDFKKTTRKSTTSGAPASVYPHQIKDKKAIARLEIAIRTFDGLVGKRRGEMDASALTDFLGDPRFARGVVACLGQFYKYVTPNFSQIVGSEAASRLAQSGLVNPIAIRAHTYAHINRMQNGFLIEAKQPECYAELGNPFCITAHLWNSLLHLDAEENQILTRPGRVPVPAEIVALYNFHSLETPLRRATKIVLSGLALSHTEAADVRSLARAWDVHSVISGDGATVTITDMEMSSLLPRRQGRLARCLLQFIQSYATQKTAGYADTLLGTRKFRLALTTETLRPLGMKIRSLGSEVTYRKRFDAGFALHKELRKLRAQEGKNSWRIKRLPEPIVTPQGILLPDFLLTRGESAVCLLLGLETSVEWGMPVISIPLGRKPLDGAAVLAQAEKEAGSLFALPAPILSPIPNAVRALCDQAASTGLVRAADARRALHLLDESPLIDWLRRAEDPRVRYVPGVGLCSREMVAAITQDQQTLFSS